MIAFFIYSNFSFSLLAFVPVAAAFELPKVAALRANSPTEDIWSNVCKAQVAESFAAPIPHPTQPSGFLLQQTGPAP